MMSTTGRMPVMAAPTPSAGDAGLGIGKPTIRSTPNSSTSHEHLEGRAGLRQRPRRSRRLSRRDEALRDASLIACANVSVALRRWA
jgi:hypothetical protein